MKFDVCVCVYVCVCVSHSPVPVGTVPIYEALERVGGDVSKITWEVFKQVCVCVCV